MTFPPTASSTTQTQCFNVTISDDDAFECQEGFVILINGSTPTVTVSSPSSAMVEIISNDGKDLSTNYICIYFGYRITEFGMALGVSKYII